MKFRITDEHDYGSKKVQLYNTEVPQDAANLAFELLMKWGPVCGTCDGEDSAGRAKMRELTPQETVNRAFDIATAAYAKARELGFMLPLPDLNEINADFDAKRQEKRAKEEAKA